MNILEALISAAKAWRDAWVTATETLERRDPAARDALDGLATAEGALSEATLDYCGHLAAFSVGPIPWLAPKGQCPSCDRRREAVVAANQRSRKNKGAKADV